jgi:hypothetical protein
MSQVRSRQGRGEQAAGRDVVLSAEERETLRRVKDKAGRKRESAFRRFGKNPPVFLWWLCW